MSPREVERERILNRQFCQSQKFALVIKRKGNKLLKQRDDTGHPFPGDSSGNWVEYFREIGDRETT